MEEIKLLQCELMGFSAENIDEIEEKVYEFAKKTFINIIKSQRSTFKNYNKTTPNDITWKNEEETFSKKLITCLNEKKLILFFNRWQCNSLIAQHMFFQGKSVKIKDIHNIRSEKNMISNPLEIKAFFERKNAKYYFDLDNNEIKTIVWMTSKQRTLLEFTDVLLIDGTYKTNNSDMPFYTLAVIDEHNHGQPLIQGLLNNEKEKTITLFLEIAYSWLEGYLKKNLVILLDKDFAEIQACKNVFTPKVNTQILLCRFHIMKSFKDNLKNIKLSAEEREMVFKNFQTMVFSPRKGAFLSSEEELKAYPEVYAYVHKCWLTEEVKSMAMGYYRQSIFHLNTNTNNKLERYHRELKKFIISSRISCYRLIEQVSKVIDLNMLERNHKTLDSKLKKRAVVGDLELFSGKVSNFCFEKLEQNYKKSFDIKNFYQKENEYIIQDEETHVTLEKNLLCSCHVYSSMEIPCSHILAIKRFKKEELFDEKLINPRWIICRTEEISFPEEVTKETFHVKKRKLMTTEQKFNSLVKDFTPIASFVSDKADDTYLQLKKDMEKLYQKYVQDKDANLCITPEKIQIDEKSKAISKNIEKSVVSFSMPASPLLNTNNLNECGGQFDTIVEQEILLEDKNNVEELVTICENLEENAKKIESDENSPIVKKIKISDNELQEATFPKIKRKRGRPRKTKQRTFKKN